MGRCRVNAEARAASDLDDLDPRSPVSRCTIQSSKYCTEKIRMYRLNCRARKKLYTVRGRESRVPRRGCS
eukprot:14061901-Heterocapsa_arctica.AAC.1